MKLIAAMACLTMAAPAMSAEQPASTQVMVLGTYHFANHNRDLHNVKSDDVLTPQRQREIAVMADRLAQWKPTKILVEVLPGATGQLLTGPQGQFDKDMLRTSREESVQVGYRIAAKVGAPVYAINEQPEGDEPDYFPFDKVASFAEKHQMEDQMAALQADAGREADEISKGLATHSIPFLLARMNQREAIAEKHSPYLRMLQFGDLSDQPGAELYAYWMMRNAKIFGKAMLVTEPGDRVLIIYGAGHAYWLRHFAAEMPGYKLVPSDDLLAKAASDLGR